MNTKNKNSHFQLLTAAFWGRLILVISMAMSLAACSSSVGTDNDTTRALLVVGPSNHPPGTHEVAAGARLVEYCLENPSNADPIQADVIDGWPADSTQLDQYATIIFFGDNFPGERLSKSDTIMQQLAKMVNRGCGIVGIHYGVGLTNEDMGTDGDHPLLHWMGGYFATRCDHHQSVARIYPAAEIKPANPQHPLSRGWSTFTLHDEPYINNYFGPNDNQFLPGAFAVARSMLPPEDPQNETIAWGIERQDGGRGVGITLPHFYKNWSNEHLRKLILNAVFWTAKKDIPPEGIQTSLPDLEEFDPVSVEYTPKTKENDR